MEQTDSTPATPSTPQHAAPAQAAPGAQPLPRTAVEIASLLASKSIDSREAGRMAGAAKVDLLDVARAHSTLKRAEAEPTPAPDTRSPEAKVMDQHFPSGKPDEFLINYGLPDGEKLSPEQTQFDQAARGWLAGAEFPRDLGNSVVKAVDQVLQHTAKMDAVALEKYAGDEFEKLQRVYGDKLEAKLNQAGRLIAELEVKRPGLKQLLRTGGVGDSALIASLLIQQSERFYARRTK